MSSSSRRRAKTSLGENLSQEVVGKRGEVAEAALSFLAPFCHQEVDIGVEINFLKKS
jgi:hypothetical protein